MQKIRIKYLITVCAGGLIGLLSLVRVAHAEVGVPLSSVESDSVCCSSVLFLPGIEGTRLYYDQVLLSGATTTRRVWEPRIIDDSVRLHLYTGGIGMSMNQFVYSGNPIDKAYGIVDIYGKFMKMLEDLKNRNIINEWKGFGYDWRYAIDDIATGNEVKATTTEYLIQTLLKMAERSKTGKVTIVAHSYGGLVTKYLTKRLSEMGAVNLLDTVVSVAVPYLGTPETIGGLLHGDHQSIGAGLLFNAERARGLASNLPSVYSLLPSKEYFTKVFSPTIAFASTTIKYVNNGLYPKEIASYKDQYDFLIDSQNARIDNRLNDFTATPTIANKTVLKAAEVIHGILDPFSWPQTITRWAIAGWNKTTTKGIVYDEKTICNAISCSTFTVHNASTTVMGDGTVVSPSATYNAGQAVSVDLKNLSKQERRNISHSNILGASSTLALVRDIISHKQDQIGADQALIDEISRIPGVTIGEPDYSKQPSFLVLSTHSPIELHVYDNEGNHTGLIQKPVEFGDLEDGLYTYFDEQIIGSKFTNIGGSQGDPEYQIYLPDDNGQKYSVVLKGTGLGKFTFDVERVQNGSFTEKVEFSAMPVTPLTVATTTVIAINANGQIDRPLASTTNILNIDIDGNGVSDISATTMTKVDENTYLELLKNVVSGLLGNSQKGKNILGRISDIEQLIKSGNLIQAHRASAKLDSQVTHIGRRTLSEKEKIQIIEMIDLYISQYE